ncbi:MAG TPA: maltose alpha-D-glucosyltransferase [Alphaproteobacteria bacterium]
MIDRTDRFWFKNAVIYEVHVKSFCDSNGDGIGDFPGLISKLDYLQDLGVTAIWLLPFYPSPLRDDGYDIAAYRAVNPAYGTMRDFKCLVKECHDRGIRVITELVINHTSDQHRWFQRARRAKKGSVYRDFYVWSDTDQKYKDARIIFVDTEKSNWAWDPVAQAYYWHRFYSHQPDLNFDNPRVLREVISVMRFWLDMGVDGVRLDAIPYLAEREGTNCENLPETHEIIRKIRAEIDAHYPDRLLLAEANQWPEDVAAYFGNGDECHMCFHFPLMPRMYMAIAQEDRHPITDIMRQTPDVPENCGWGIFLRNHDELTLEMVTNRERDYLWNFFAVDKKARLNLGIRRRLAPLLDNDRRKIELMNSLLFSMPGTPIMYYGDEIGMGDNVYLGDRDGVRTPMQWSPDRNGGFSRADPSHLFLPPIMDPLYSYEAVNVEAQTRSQASLLNWMKRLLSMRQQNKALRVGGLRFLYPGNRKILAYLREADDEAILCVANLSHSAQAVELDLVQFKPRVPVEMLGRSAFPPIGDLPYLITLPAYGFHWFVLPQAAQMPHWHVEAPPPLPDFITLVMKDGWRSVWSGREARELETDVLPAYLSKQRWFSAKNDRIVRARICATPEVTNDKGSFVLLQTLIELASSDHQRYFLPLAVSWDDNAGTMNWPLLPYMLAKVRRRSKVGAVYEATATEQFALAAVDLIRQGKDIDSEGGRVVSHSTSAFAALEIVPETQTRRVGGEQSNSSVTINDQMILKAYRRLADGEHPEVEMSRFLTEVAGYPNTPKLFGSIEYVERDGTKWALAVLQEFMRSQGDGWMHAMDYLDRVFDGMRQMDPKAEPMPGSERHAVYLNQIRVLARRIAELHRALATDSQDPAFAPEPITGADMTQWRRGALAMVEGAFSALRKYADAPPTPATAQVRAALDRQRECVERIRALTDEPLRTMKTRIHGDLHLGQVLVVKDDYQIIDFEGEPTRPVAERRAKSSPLRDVAGMLRSIQYAAWSALYNLADRDPDGFEKLLPYAMEWKKLVQDAFLDGYTAAIGDCISWPADVTELRRALSFFLLYKVLYETCYEAANRPNWIRIPVTGLIEVLDALRRPKEGTLAAA